MPTVATIPVTIQPDAAAFLAEIGQERELEMMLEHAKATIPHLAPWTSSSTTSPRPARRA